VTVALRLGAAPPRTSRHCRRRDRNPVPPTLWSTIPNAGKRDCPSGSSRPKVRRGIGADDILMME
jgi:hypothetical protein